jgi:hypothetical protein
MNPNNAQELQRQLFNAIKQKLPKGENLARHIADALNLSPDAAYKKIRGERLLDLQDLQLLFQTYKLSYEDMALDTATQKVWFSCNNLQIQPNFEDYLQFIAQQLQLLLDKQVKSLTCSAGEVPLFYYCMFPELIQFKAYVWQQSILPLTETQLQPFSLDQTETPLLQLAQEINYSYLAIPSQEIWASETIGSLYRQLRFYKEAQLFATSQTYEVLMAAFKALLQHVKQQTLQQCKIERYSKTKRAPFALYHNELLPGDDSLLAQLPGQNMAIFLPHSLQAFVSTDVRVTQALAAALHGLKQQSICLTQQCERYIAPFFES